MNQLLRDAKEFCLPVWWSCQRDRIVLYVQTAPQFENGSVRKRIAYRTYSVGNALLFARRLLGNGINMSVEWFRNADLWRYGYEVELSPLLRTVREQASEVSFPSNPRWEAYAWEKKVKEAEQESSINWWRDSPYSKSGGE